LPNKFNLQTLSASTGFWVILNLLGLYFLGEEDSRWLRVAASSYFILWSLYFEALKAKMHYVLLSF
jgi:hypothetical protein